MQLTSLSLAISRIMGGGAWSPFSLFAAGEQGAWYDPSDLTTLFQDAAGTTPVTAVEQRVGLMLDKSGRGNHAFQATTTPNDKRPILSARVNLLTKTEQFDNAIWAKTNASVTANAAIAPDGTTTADSIVVGAAPSTSYLLQNLAASNTGILSCYAKAGTGRYFDIVRGTFTSGDYAIFDLLTGTVTQPPTYSGSTATITPVGNTGYFKCSLTSAQSTQINAFSVSGGPTGTSTRAGVTDNIYIWGADLRPANIGNNIPAYQRVNTATDYDTAGFPYYLKADGAYTSMSTNSINFSATNNMTVVSGVRKLSDAAQGVVSELSATSASNNGSFTLSAPGGAATNYTWLSKGTTADTVTATPYTSPISGVLTGLASISAPSNTIRVNGTATSDTNTQGTGNYGNYPLYLFARNNSSSFLNGYFYGAIIRGATTSGTDLTNAESYMNTKSGGLY